MSTLPKIPCPPSHYWREFRHSVMPFVVFIGVLVFTIYLWQGHVAPPSIVGEVETIRTSVTPTVHGELVELHVDLLQQVKKGDPIATVVVMDDEMVSATVNAARADLLTLQVRLHQDELQMKQSQVRALESYESLKQNVLVRRVERATEKANLKFAESELKRQQELIKSKTIPQSEYDLAESQRDALAEKISELDKLIAEMDASMEKIRPQIEAVRSANITEPINKAIAAEERLITEETKPQIIRAPMDGVISAVYKRKGEKVVRGLPIVLISTMEPERIIGYVRQPLNIHPKVGDVVEVRSRSFNRPSARTQIIKVGTQLELINIALLPQAVQTVGGMEYGLPVLINLPKSLNLMPGETVDISVIAKK